MAPSDKPKVYKVSIHLFCEVSWMAEWTPIDLNVVRHFPSYLCRSYICRSYFQERQCVASDRPIWRQRSFVRFESTRGKECRTKSVNGRLPLIRRYAGKGLLINHVATFEFFRPRQRYALVTQTDKNENWIERVTEMDIKKKKKSFSDPLRMASFTFCWLTSIGILSGFSNGRPWFGFWMARFSNNFYTCLDCFIYTIFFLICETV